MNNEERISILKDEREKLYDKISKINDEIQNLEIKKTGFDSFEGKYVHDDEHGYMFVYWQKVDKSHLVYSCDCMFFQGFSFDSVVSPYLDTDFARYDALEDWYIPLDRFVSDCEKGKFKEISKLEFEMALDEFNENILNQTKEMFEKCEDVYKTSYANNE